METALLTVIGLLALLPLDFQLKRWANGLDPTLIHPRWLEHSEFPAALLMVAVHPVVWMVLALAAFYRICKIYGWRLER